MKTKIFLTVILGAILTGAAYAQPNTNPKLNYTTSAWRGNILVVNWDNYIEVSDKSLDDFNKMQTSIAIHDLQLKSQQETDEKQQETIRKQQAEITDLKAENKELKSDFSQLERTVNDLKKKLEEIERALKN